MARQTLDRNVKYKLLLLRARPLGLTKPQVRGLLETMWDVAHECGNTDFPTADHVEAAAEWWGESGAWVALISASDTNFVDLKDGGGYEIHDYWDHCPSYVKDRLYQETRRKRTREHVSKKSVTVSKKSVTVSDESATVSDESATPTPTPTPTKKYIPPTTLAAPCPLECFPRLQKLYPGIREHLLAAHPMAKLPKVESRQGITERETLARLIRLDGYREGEVIHALRWVLKADSDQADFWRSNFRAVGQLRKVKDGGTKFTKIFDAMKRDPDWPDVPPDPVATDDAPEQTPIIDDYIQQGAAA